MGEITNLDKSAEQYLQDAIKYYNAGQYEEAVRICDIAIQLDPMCARAYHGRGLIYTRQKRYTDAYNDYQKSHELMPGNAKLLIDMGKLFCSLNNYKEAGKYYRYAIEFDGKYSAEYNSRINIMINDAFAVDSPHNFSLRKRAIDILKRVVLFNPENERAKYFLSCWQIALKNRLDTIFEP